MKKKKILFFFIFSNLIIFLTLYLSSNLILRIFYTPNILLGEDGEYDLRIDVNPFMEFNEDIGYHIRRAPFTKKTKAYPVALGPGSNVPGIISYDLKEGIVRSNRGDILINKWGFRGPYVEKEKPNRIYRIVTLGGSTTAGKYENEQTYPRLLERMLNNQSDGRQYYQVLNFGVWGYNTCDLKTIYKKEVLGFDPDMIIIMSGWNDITKQGQKGFKSIDDYCDSNFTVLSNSSLYRLIKYWIKTPWQEIKFSDQKLKNLGQNSIFYLKNMREIISDAQKRNILVGLVDLPALYETATPNETFKKLKQFTYITIDQMDYQLTSGLKINKLIRQIATEFENTFHVNHSISFNTKDKSIFFSDEIHSTGAGNRLLAFNVMEKINKFRANKLSTIKRPKSKPLNKNELEAEFLKSIASSFNIEDLAFVSCIVYYGRCTFVPGITGNEYLTSVTEFSLGVLLNFPEEIQQPKHFKNLETNLLNAIKIAPEFSPPYWILSQIYYINSQTKTAKLWEEKAKLMNPLLNSSLFVESINKRSIKDNKLFESLSDFLNAFKNKPPAGIYKIFNQLKKPLASKKNQSYNMARYYKAYYLTPLLVRSIFEDSIGYLKSAKKFKTALELIQKLKSAKPEYDFEKLISEYENDINKMKLASANGTDLFP